MDYCRMGTSKTNKPKSRRRPTQRHVNRTRDTISLALRFLFALELVHVYLYHNTTSSTSVDDATMEISVRNRATLRTFGPRPIQVSYDQTTNVASIVSESALIDSKTLKITEVVYPSMPIRVDTPKDGKECVLTREWHAQNPQVCNPSHELDIESNTRRGNLEFIAYGGNRCTFHIKDADGVTSLALKKQKYKHKPRPHHKLRKDADNTRRDSLTMERLTKSPYVLNIYNQCGASQVLEYASGGNIFNLIQKARKKRRDDMSPEDKLRIAIQIASAVADLHTFEDDGMVSVTHNDICCDQFVYVDGVYKLNDFHLSSFIEKHKNSDEICKKKRRVQDKYTLIHAPEESYRSMVDNERADDYVTGNVMYYVLTKKWIFEDLSTSKGIQSLQEGKRPSFPKHIQNSTDLSEIAIMKAINMLWTHDVTKRPSSREVSRFLIEQLETITGEKVNGVVRVSVPPFPHNFDFSNDDDAGFLQRPND